MGLDADLDGLDGARGGVENVDDVVITGGEPELLAVRADIAHVRAAAAGDGPGDIDLLGGEVQHGDAAGPALLAMDHVRAAVGDVELPAVAAGVEAVGALAGLDEADLLEGLVVDDEDAVGLMSATYQRLPSGEERMSCGMPPFEKDDVADDLLLRRGRSS
jgi:hypothetical protein